MINRILEQVNPDGSITELIEIKAADDSVTVMLKSIYDAQQAEQSTLLLNAVGIDKVE
jgi:hypothetical protein